MKIPDTSVAGIDTTTELVTAMDRYPAVPELLPSEMGCGHSCVVLNHVFKFIF